MTVDVSSLVLGTDMMLPLRASEQDITLQTQTADYSLLLPPTWALDDRVLARFFSKWAVGGTCLGSQRFVSKIYGCCNPRSALSSAIKAIAYADLTTAERRGDFAAESFRMYLATLRRVHFQLDAPLETEATANDELLTAILALDSFEVRN